MSRPSAGQRSSGWISALRLVAGGGGGRNARSGGVDAFDALSDLAETVIPESDSASAVPRPDQVGEVWVEQQTEQLVAEQAQLYTAEGLLAARSYKKQAAGLKTAAEVAVSQVANAAVLAGTACQYAQAARQALSPYLVRPPGSKGWYVGRMVALLGGDVAAVTGACVLLGEIPALAALLALSTGAAAVIGGLAGGEAKRLRLAEQRKTREGDLPERLEPWRHLFIGGQAGRGLVKLMVLVSVLILVCLGVGVIALRTGLDGMLSGLAFGSFSLAIGLGSLWNCYDYADEVADLLDAADKAYAKAERRYRRVGSTPVIQACQAAVAIGGSIQAEYAARGEAAGHHVRATLYAVLNRHPQIVGHGLKPDGDQLGRRQRKAA